MRVQESREMYLEAIYVLKKEKEYVRAKDIVLFTGYSKPSVSRALGLLRENGLITIDVNGYISLTEDGENKSKKIYERHGLLSELFEYLGVEKQTAENDACKIEHVISDETFDKIKIYCERHLKK